MILDGSMASRPQQKRKREIRRTAELMAEERMKEIMAQLDANKPTFEEVKEKFYAIADVRKACSGPTYDIVLDLAEKALFAEIKGGVKES